MFPAQTEHWEETQEKMSQLVSRSAIFVSCSTYCPNEHCLCFFFSPIFQSDPYLLESSRWRSRRSWRQTIPASSYRSSAPAQLCLLPMWTERFVASKTVLDRYSYSLKGHWIQDCPTNNDRDYDHRPRIKRTTGIPRSFLKAVDNPTTGPIGHGVMVTPEGGYVVAQPDSYVYFHVPLQQF